MCVMVFWYMGSARSYECGCCKSVVPAIAGVVFARQLEPQIIVPFLQVLCRSNLILTWCVGRRSISQEFCRLAAG